MKSTGFAGARPMQNGDRPQAQTAVPKTARPENEASGPWPSQKVLRACVRHSQLGNSCNYQRPIFGFVQEKFAQKVCNFQLVNVQISSYIHWLCLRNFQEKFAPKFQIFKRLVRNQALISQKKKKQTRKKHVIY